MNRFVRSLRLVVLAALLVMAFAAVLPASAAPGGVILSYTLNEAGCYVDVTAQVQDAGYYAINMWDDGSFRAGAGGNIPAGGTFSVRFSIGGVILQGAAGIGVYLEDGVGLAASTTYDSDGSINLWSDTVGTNCANAGTPWGATIGGNVILDCPNPRPTTAAVYNVPAGALAFFAPDANSYAGFNLPPGTWYVSDFGAEYAKVWISCQANSIYIPVANIIR